jgi:hypothetical protein
LSPASRCSASSPSIVETFKDAFGIKAQTPLDLLYVGATIALVGLALYLTLGAESEKDSEQSSLPPSREGSARDAATKGTMTIHRARAQFLHNVIH